MDTITDAITDKIKLLQQWLNGVKINQVGYLRAAAHYKRIGRSLGLAITITSVFISTSVFSGLSSSKNEILLILTGTISVITAVLAGLQTFLNYPEIAVKNQTAALRYGRLRRRIEEILVSVKNPDELKQVIQVTQTEWEQIDEESPGLSQHFHDLAVKIVKPDIARQRESIKSYK